jgi:hypothetical protein
MRRGPVTFYACAAFVTVVLGLAVRRGWLPSTSFVARFAPDALWASLIYWLGSIAFRRSRPVAIAAGAFAFSVAVELSQLYHAPWIDAVRANRFAALVLGSGFLWGDLACYAGGVLLAYCLDAARCSLQSRLARSAASDASA